MSPQPGQSPAATDARLRASSSLDAVLFAEGLVTERMFASLETDALHANHLTFPRQNAFGEEILTDKSLDFSALVVAAKEAAESGVRVTLIGAAPEVLSARRALRQLVAQRLGVTVHVLSDPHAMRGAVYGLLDLGFGLLFASGPEDSFDLSLIARRAAEDSGVPFFVVHEYAALTSFEVVAIRDADALAGYVGSSRARLVKVSDPAHPVFVPAHERAFARRASFALSSAMREFEAVAHRRHDIVERIGPSAGSASFSSGTDTDVVLVGLGVVGDTLLGVAERARSGPRPISALKITALRPLDGPRLVKTLARAHAVTVIEAGLDPLTETMPLARELKSAFTDAITWAPGYPGVGRVPRFTSAVVGQGGLTEEDLTRAITNMRDGENAARSFVFGEDDAPTNMASDDRDPAPSPRVRISCRDHLAAAKVAECILSVIAHVSGLRCRAMLRPGEEGSVYVDTLTLREPTRAEPARSSFDWFLHQREDLATTAALAAAFMVHGQRAAVDGAEIARAIALATGDPSDFDLARTAVDSGRWRTRVSS